MRPAPTGDRITDFVSGKDTIGFSTLLVGFHPGDRLRDFVRSVAVAGGLEAGVDPDSSGDGFVGLVLLDGEAAIDTSIDLVLV